METAPPAPRADMAAAIVFVGDQGSMAGDSTAVRVHTLHGTLLDAALPPTITRRVVLPAPPEPLPDFRNRQAEQAELHQEIAAGRGAWVYGVHGCGSSALLRQAASAPAARALPDGVVSIVGQHEPPALDDLMHRLLWRFYTGSAAFKLAPSLALAYLGNLQALFLFDRLPLPPADIERLLGILADSPLLVASDRPGPDMLLHMPLDGLPFEEAVSLCAAVAQLDTSQPPAPALLERLCRTLEQLPLPLLLLARLVAGDTAKLVLLVESVEETPGEHGPLTRAVSVLLAHLSDDERALLAAIIAAGGAGADSALLSAICQRPPDVLEQAYQRLTALGIVESSNGRAAVASPGLQQALDAALKPAEERKRVAAHLAALLPSQAHNLEWLEQQRGSLMAALQTALTQGEMAQAAALARGIAPALVLGGLWEQWEQVMTWAARAARASGDQSLSAWALHERGTRAGLLGDRRTATDALRRAFYLRRSLGDAAGAAASYHNMEYLGILPAPPPSQRKTAPRYARTKLSRGHWLVAALPLLLILMGLLLRLLFPGLVPASSAFGLPPTATISTQVAAAPTSTATTAVENVPSATPLAATVPVVPGTVPRPSPTFRALLTPEPDLLLSPTIEVLPTAPLPLPPPVYPPPLLPATDIPLPPTVETTDTPEATPTRTSTPQEENTSTATLPADDEPDGSQDEDDPAESTATRTPPSETDATDTPAAETTASAEPSTTATPEDSTVPPAPELLEPEDTLVLDCVDTVILSWAEVEDESGITGYDWILEESPDNSEDSYTSNSSGTTEETAVEIEEIRCDMWYRWRVRAVDGAGNVGPFAENFLFGLAPANTPTPTPDTVAPQAPGPFSPADDEEFLCSESVDLSWSAVDDPSGIDRYEWELEYSSDGSTGSYRLDSGRSGSADGTSVTISGFSCDAETWYRWRVRAIDGAGNEGDFFNPDANFRVVPEETSRSRQQPAARMGARLRYTH